MKAVAGLLVLLVGAQIVSESTAGRVCDEFCLDCCKLQFKSHGCYKHRRGNPSPENLLLVDTKEVGETWNDFMFDFICRCAEEASAKTYKYFGIHGKDDKLKCYAGNSWTIPPTSEKCQTCDHEPCVRDVDKFCVGKKKGIFIYELAEPCDIKILYVGCFKDKPKPNRAMKDYALTGRQNLQQLAKVKRINWGGYNWWLPTFACECAHKAQESGRKFFGLQFWGECWIGDKSQPYPVDYDVYGSDGAECNDNCFHKCKKHNCGHWCVGQLWSNAVYKIVQK